MHVLHVMLMEFMLDKAAIDVTSQNKRGRKQAIANPITFNSVRGYVFAESALCALSLLALLSKEVMLQPPNSGWNEGVQGALVIASYIHNRESNYLSWTWLLQR